jgi:hypothetical protein
LALGLEKPSASPPQTSLWLLGLLGILGVVSWFRSKSDTPIIQSTNPQPSDDNAADQPARCQNISERPIRVVIESLPPRHAPTNERTTEKKKKTRREWYGIGIQTLTLLGVLWYACIARDQWREMINARRPWVGVDDKIVLTAYPSFTPAAEYLGKKYVRVRFPFSVTIRNFGESPAHDEYDFFATYYVGVMKQGADEKMMKFQSFLPPSCSKTDDMGTQDHAQGTSTIFPAQTKVAHDSVGDILVPVEDWFLHGGLGIVGCIVYQDSLGRTRHTKVRFEAAYPDEQTHHTVYANPLFVYYEITEFKLVDSEAD